jgi:maltose alpha-D-glucosyltransferase/alpha-amylase
MAKAVISKRDEFLNSLKNIYSKKLDIVKIRNHGTLGLRKLLLTGKDLVIHDFGGNPLRSYSERRIKRSPLRDVAEMLTSIHYVAREAVINNSIIQKEDGNSLAPFAEQWTHYMSSFYLKTYLDCVEGTEIIPQDKEELTLLLNFFRVQSALHHLLYELNNRHEYITIPLEILSSILQLKEEEVIEVAD